MVLGEPNGARPMLSESKRCTARGQEELERQQEEAKRRLEDRSSELDTREKEALLEQFKRDEARVLPSLGSPRYSPSSPDSPQGFPHIAAGAGHDGTPGVHGSAPDFHGAEPAPPQDNRYHSMPPVIARAPFAGVRI